MPIVGWICPTVIGSDAKPHGCGGKNVPLDHFSTTECGEWICHPHVAGAIWDQSYDHMKVAGDPPTVTGGLYCPRESAIMNQEAVHIDPRRENSKMVGTAWGYYLEQHAPMEESEVDVSGELWGMKVSGRADVLRKDRGLIEDWKHSNDFVTKYVKAEGTKDNYVAQLSMYAELCGQSLGWRPARGIVWHHFAAEGQWPVRVELWALDKIAAYRPSGGQFTVPELLAQTKEWIEGKSWRELPLAGESQQFGKAMTACDYCSVKSVCWKQAKGAPF